MRRRTGVWARVALRLAGLPRSPRQLDLGLRLLAAYRRLGWFASGSGGARSARGEPLPWWTYGALLWLDGHLAAAPRPPAACLELGAGSSTLWLARRFARVVSLEHDERWVRRLSARVPANVELRQVDAADEAGYLAACDEREGGWDLVVIDGLHRAAALARAAERLAPGGLALLDDADRPQYAEAIRAAGRRGLARIDFHGFAPAVAHLRCTSVFGRPDDLATRAPAPAWFGHSLAAYREL